MAEDQAQKTEPATEKRREDTRKKGEVAQSRDVASVAVLIAAFLAIALGAGVALVQITMASMQHAFQAAARPPGSLGGLHGMLIAVAAPPMLALFPLIAVFALSGGASQLIQIGPLVSGKALQPKLERLSPLKGIKRMFHYNSLVNLVKAILQVSVVCAVAWAVIRSDLQTILGLQRLPLLGVLIEVGRMARSLVIALLAVLATLAMIDLLYQRWRFEQKLKMTKQEVRDEIRQRDGDPHARGHMRSMQRELSRSRMIAAVAVADVVITNPTHYAVALRYERESMAAPEVVARGRGYVALRIREVAREAGVPIVENRPLARVLHDTTKVGREVPENLFRAVAEVLAHVYRVDGDRARGARSWAGAF